MGSTGLDENVVEPRSCGGEKAGGAAGVRSRTAVESQAQGENVREQLVLEGFGGEEHRGRVAGRRELIEQPREHGLRQHRVGLVDELVEANRAAHDE